MLYCRCPSKLCRERERQNQSAALPIDPIKTSPVPQRHGGATARPSASFEKCSYNQFSDGFSTWSMTSVSTGAREGSSLIPLCFCTLLKGRTRVDRLVNSWAFIRAISMDFFSYPCRHRPDCSRPPSNGPAYTRAPGLAVRQKLCLSQIPNECIYCWNRPEGP
jgi:hypothetical protein